MQTKTTTTARTSSVIFSQIAKRNKESSRKVPTNIFSIFCWRNIAFAFCVWIHALGIRDILYRNLIYGKRKKSGSTYINSSLRYKRREKLAREKGRSMQCFMWKVAKKIAFEYPLSRSKFALNFFFACALKWFVAPNFGSTSTLTALSKVRQWYYVISVSKRWNALSGWKV
ncbi:hypothetical protein TNCV_4750921 [Trichonephila clavipes]|nr:hypothetical protein TNCV_4750921 [Trichonephila clavipes]